MARRPFNHPWVDETHRPIYVCRFPNPIPQDQYEDYISHLDKWVNETNEPYGWVIYPDLHTSKQRAQMAESQARRAQHDKLYCSCYSFVVANPITRGVITAVMWVTPPAAVNKVFDNEVDALSWAAEAHKKFLARDVSNR